MSTPGSAGAGAPPDFDPFAGPALALSAPSTESQREIWAAARMGDDASCAFNESCSLALRGPLDAGALEGAVQDLAARHEALRTTFTADGTTLCVAEPGPVPLPLVDLSAAPEPERRARLERLLQDAVERPFDLEQGPLFRLELARLAADEHVLVLTAHHVVCDGFSTGVLVRELAALYGARRAGAPAALPPAFPFSRYARELAEGRGSPEHAAAERYWLGQFASPPPALDLPVDRRRPPVKSYPSRRVDTFLEPELVGRLRGTAARSRASLFNALLAGFDVLLSRLSGQEDVVVGVPAAGQAAADHPTLVGHCVNTLALRTRVERGATFEALLRSVRTTLLDGLEHQRLGFGGLVQKLALPRDPSRLPLASVMFNLDQPLSGADLPFPGLEAEFRSNPRRFENFDLFVNAVDLGPRLQLEWQYNTDLFDEETIRTWARAYETLLRDAADHPGREVGRLELVSAADRRRLAAWNDASAIDYPRDRLAHQLVEAEAARAPDRVAVTCGDAQLTYRELDRRANRLARRLRALGAGRDVLVGLYLERSPELVVALLAVAKSGAAYVPLDPAYPAARLAFMVADSRMPILVTEERLRGSLPEHRAQVVSVDGDREAIAREGAAPLAPPPGATTDDVLYVIYTSGSTGAPKGVLVPHRAAVNLLTGARAAPGLGPGDVILAITTLSFDIAVYDLWMPLTVGARIALAPKEAAGDGPLLRSLLRGAGATALQATPATWRLLIAAGWEGERPLKVISTGEALPHDLAEQLVARSGEVWDMYGPTETTVWSTGWRVPSPVGAVLIGRPLANTQLHVLDRDGQPVPVGVVGELYIGGDGVTRGYLDRPALTAERFLPDPFRRGGTLYRTGDVARFRQDGQVEYLGRNDGQVKVRGFRIELGEIEVALARHPAVRQAVVAAREDRPGDVRLAAYVVPAAGRGADEEVLRQHLRGLVPEYMVPQHFLALEALPLTPNGKIDRKALPAPEAGARAADAYVAPRTDGERLLARLWEEALGVARIGVHDDFFALGGHSLLAAQLIARLAREHGVALPMRRMFEAPTIARFAPLLGAGRAEARIPRLAADGPAPVSFMQERVWNLEQLQPGRAVFNLPIALRLQGALDAKALERAVAAFFERHEAARTTLDVQGGQVVQKVAPPRPFTLEITDLSSDPGAPGAPGPMELMVAEAARPFDLVAGPLVRVRLFRLAPEEHVLFVLPHHAIWDGWSFDVLARDLAELYASFAAGRPPALPPLPLRYRDFAAWHREWLRSPEVEAQAAWWRRQLAGSPAPLELPTDRPRPRAVSDAGAILWLEIPREEVDAATALAQRHGATLFQVLLAAYVAALHRHAGQDEVLVGTPVRGRALPELEDVVGTFVNTLVLRTRLDGAPSFTALLGRVRQAVVDAFAHEDVPFELLAMSDKPAFRALFSFQDVRGRPARFGDLALSQLEVHPPVALNDVSLWIMGRDAGLLGGLAYSTDLFDAATMERFLATFRAVLRGAVADPERPVARLEIATDEERAGVVGEGGGPVPLLDALDRHADGAPERAALADAGGGVSLRYDELRRRAEAVAARLRRAGLAPGGRVGLRAGLSARGVVGALAIARAGGVCVPLDPAEPEARLERVLALARPGLLLAEDGHPPLPGAAGLPVVVLDLADAGAVAGPARSPGADAPALVLAAPRADGELAAVELSHGELAAAVGGVARVAGIGPGDAVLATSPLATGYGLAEAWLGLAAGARVVVDAESGSDPERLPELLGGAGITVLPAAAFAWRALSAAGWRGGPGFKALCLGAPPAELAAELAGRAGQALALHGDAESGLWSGVARLDGGAPGWRPLPGIRWRVVDAAGGAVPHGVPGELVVEPAAAPGGDGRALRTGERARLLRDGRAELLGRRDDRCTYRGWRVEPREVERALEAHPEVARAGVALRRDELGEDHLVACLVLRPGAAATRSELRAFLRERLPDPLVPRDVLELDALPEAGGALDRAALPSPFRGARRERVAPRTEAERTLAAVWQEALGVADVDVRDNFFDLGGHSLLCLQAVAELERRTGRRLSPRSLLLDTLEQAAAKLAAGARPAA